jgi:hypothetical protein
MPTDEIARRLHAQHWRYAPFDPESVTIIESRLADAGRRKTPIRYSDVAQGINFDLPNGKEHVIDTHDSTPFDRNLIGDFLGFISARTYAAHGFMASALAGDAINMLPSEAFFRLALDVGLVAHNTERDRNAFWIRQLDLAHEYYRQQPLLPTAAEFYLYARTVLEGATTTLSIPPEADAMIFASGPSNIIAEPTGCCGVQPAAGRSHPL